MADPPAIGHDRRLARVWTGEQIRDFLAAIDDHDLYPLFLLAVATGMRRGELAGLRWSDIDFDAARLTVNRQIRRRRWDTRRIGPQDPK